MISWINYALLYSYYAVFFLVPLTFTSNTYELFEFNKMWLTFILALWIGTFWAIKMVLQGRIYIQKTPLDIPIVLFVLSQIISTIFSLDGHVSFWGYYSRFNGGLLSIIAYILLYYAFISNYKDLATNTHTDDKDTFQNLLLTLIVPAGIVIVGLLISPQTGYSSALFIIFVLISFISAWWFVRGGVIKRIITLGLSSGIIVALWGFPSHFGFDPTCLLFRGTLDVSCWTDAFQPKIRIFSTFGQPNWLAAYLSVVLSITIGLLLSQVAHLKSGISKIPSTPTLYLSLITLFYLDLIFTRSQSGFLGFIGALGVIFLVMLRGFRVKPGMTVNNPSVQMLSIVGVLCVAIAFFIGQPIPTLNKFTLPELRKLVSSSPTHNSELTTPLPSVGELGGTDSGTIRKIVWQGAIDIWKENKLIGTGVETYAFAYYKYRPTAHNLTSEWDYLYNKAHNEYLNFLATTGAFGFLSYIGMIGTFLFIAIRYLTTNNYHLSSTQKQSQDDRSSIVDNRYLALGLLAAYVSILVSNFFGFSVVGINVYFFLIPAFVLVLLNRIDLKQGHSFGLTNTKHIVIRIFQGLTIALVVFISFLMLFILLRYWLADVHFAKGYNFDRAGQYQEAYPELRRAVLNRSSEPTFNDEYSFNTAVLATLLGQENQATDSASLAEESELVSDYTVETHPNNVVFWKTRVRSYYALSQLDPSYLAKALSAIQQASLLAPTDAKVSYNLGVLYGQNDKPVKAIETLEKTIQLKPDYLDAHYALGLYYRDLATDEKGNVVDSALQKKAIERMEFIVNHFSKEQATQAQETLESWEK